MELIKIVNYQKPYVSKLDGKEHPSTDIYLELDTPNGKERVAINAKWPKNYRDRALLDAHSKVEIIRKAE